MKVYVLTLIGVRNHGEGDEVVGVFSTKEKAEKFCTKYYTGGWSRMETEIEEWEVT